MRLVKLLFESMLRPVYGESAPDDWVGLEGQNGVGAWIPV